MRTLIEMAHEVYGEHTFWTEAQLLRLKELERLVRADERERLKASIALDKKAENAREIGLDYEPAVQEGRDWSLLEATQESLREHMAEIKRLKAAQPEIKLKGKNHG
jgi:hypothetical protein